MSLGDAFDARWKQALHDGANYLVIGRQVTRAADPRREVERILEEIA